MEKRELPASTLEFGAALAGRTELLDPEVMADALLLCSSIMNPSAKPGAVIERYRSLADFADADYATALDAPMFLEDIPKKLKDVLVDQSTCDLHTWFTEGVLSSVEAGKVSPRMMSIAKSASPGFIAKVKQGRRLAVDLLPRVLQDPENLAFETYVCRSDVRHKVEKKYFDMSISGIEYLADSGDGRRMRLEAYRESVSERLKKLEADTNLGGGQRMSARQEIFTDVMKKARQVVERGRFAKAADATTRDALMAVVVQHQNWRDHTAESDQSIDQLIRTVRNRYRPEETAEPASSEQPNIDSEGLREAELARAAAEAAERKRQEAAQELISGVLTRAEDLVDMHDVMMRGWRSTSKALKQFGLQSVTHELVVGAAGEDWELAGQSSQDVNKRLGAIVSLRNRYLMSGDDLSDTKESISMDLLAEEIAQGGMEGLRAELEKYMGAIEARKVLPQFHDSLLTDLQWVRQNWEALKHVFVGNEAAVDFIPAVAALLDLSSEVPVSAEEVVDEVVLPTEKEPVALAEDMVIHLGDQSDANETDGTEDEPVETTEASLGDLIDMSLAEIAVQLDWEVFPAETTMEEIEAKIRRELQPDEIAKTEWQRIRDLKRLADMAKGELYRSKSRSLGSRPPYYVAVFSLADKTFAVAENPVWGNATYIIREDLADGSWKDVLEHTRSAARDKGAVRVFHRKAGNRSHITKLLDSLQDLITVKTAV